MSGLIAAHLRSNIVGYVAVFIALSGTAYAVDGPLPGQDQVGSEDIINAEVKSQDLAANSVGDGKIVDGAVKSADIATGAVTSGDVADDTTAGALTGTDIADESLSGSDIGFNALESSDIADRSIDGIDIGLGQITNAEIGTAAVGQDEIAANAVNSGHIIDGAITNDDLGADSVTGAKVFPSSLSGSDILANSLTSSDIGEGAVGSSEVANNSLTSSNLGEGAVGSSEVANGSLGTAEFAGSIPAVQVTRTTAQGVLNNTATTLNFDSERYDTAGLHSNSSNLSRLTAPVAGIYAVTASIAWQGQFVESGSRTFVLRKNGATEVAIEQVNASVAPSGNVDVNFATMLRLGAGEYLQARVLQNSGETLEIRTQTGENGPEFSMAWLAPGP